VAVKHLDKRRVVLSIGPTNRWPTASLIKLAVHDRILPAGAPKETSDLAQHVVLAAGKTWFRVRGFLTKQFSAGASFSLRDAVRLMIAFSDNNGDEPRPRPDRPGCDAAKYMDELGCPNTKINSRQGLPSARRRSFLSAAGSLAWGAQRQRNACGCLDLLHRRQHRQAPEASDANAGASAGPCDDKKKFFRGSCPEGTKLAHKTGSVDAIPHPTPESFIPLPAPIALVRAHERE